MSPTDESDYDTTILQGYAASDRPPAGEAPRTEAKAGVERWADRHRHAGIWYVREAATPPEPDRPDLTPTDEQLASWGYGGPEGRSQWERDRDEPMMARLLTKANDLRYSNEWIGNAFRAAFSLLGPEHAHEVAESGTAQPLVDPDVVWQEAYRKGFEAGGTALPLDLDACDGSMLERAIRNTRREQLAKGWTGNLTDGWTIAAEYNRLLAEDRRLSESGSPPAIDRSKSGRILSIGGESGSPTSRTPHFWSDDDERTPGPTPPGAEPRDVD